MWIERCSVVEPLVADIVLVYGIGLLEITRYKKVLLCKGHCGEVL